MNLKKKLLLFLTQTFVIFLLSVIGGYLFFSYRSNEYKSQEQKRLKYTVSVSMKMLTEGLDKVIYDNTFWDDMANFANNVDTTWAEQYVHSLFNSAEAHYIWVYNRQGDLSYYVHDAAFTPLHRPFQPSVLFQLFDTAQQQSKRYAHFFTEHANQIIEVAGMTIHSTNDLQRQNSVHGVLLVGRIISKSYLQKLSVITNSNVTINLKLPVDLHSQEVQYMDEQLLDWQGRNVGFLRFVPNDTYLQTEKTYNFWSLVMYCAVLLILVVQAYYIILKNVYRPLSSVSKSLDNMSPTPIRHLQYRRDEFGQISKLITNFFTQKRELENEIEERKVIQAELFEANKMFEQQTNELEHRTAETMESIHYAGRIQAAVMAWDADWRPLVDDYFILFKPKATVSGDFYWVKQINHYLVIAAADCTGHGVPAGFMSMLGIALLNEITRRPNITEANQVLDEMRTQLKSALYQSDKKRQQREGMDISLCVINLKTKVMQYAGANQPLYLFKKQNNGQNVFQEINPDHQPVGYSRVEKPFTCNHILLEEGDIFYIFSDGYVSQFGGTDAETFKSVRFKELLQAIHHLPMDEQKEILDQTMMNWKGNNLQIDDILVMGVRM